MATRYLLLVLWLGSCHPPRPPPITLSTGTFAVAPTLCAAAVLA